MRRRLDWFRILEGVELLLICMLVLQPYLLLAPFHPLDREMMKVVIQTQQDDIDWVTANNVSTNTAKENKNHIRKLKTWVSAKQVEWLLPSYMQQREQRLQALVSSAQTRVPNIGDYDAYMLKLSDTIYEDTKDLFYGTSYATYREIYNTVYHVVISAHTDGFLAAEGWGKYYGELYNNGLIKDKLFCSAVYVALLLRLVVLGKRHYERICARRTHTILTL